MAVKADKMRLKMEGAVQAQADRVQEIARLRPHYMESDAFEEQLVRWAAKGWAVAEEWGENPLCGDEVRLAVARDRGAVCAAAWTGYCCTLCAASAEAALEWCEKNRLEVGEGEAVLYEGVIAAMGNPQVSRMRRRCVETPLQAALRLQAGWPTAIGENEAAAESTMVGAASSSASKEKVA